MELEQDVIEAPEVEGEIIEAVEETTEEQPEATDVSEGAPEDAGLVIDLSSEEEPEEEPIGIRNLRNRVKELTAKVKEYEKAVPVTQAEALPPEPELEDYDYDAAAFKVAHAEWVRKSFDHERRMAEQQEQAAKVEQRWQQKITRYEEGRVKLGASDYDEAEAIVTDVLAKPFIGLNAPDVRLNVIKNVATDPNAVIYALGKNEAKAKELADIDDVTVFAAEIGRLEAKMKIVRPGAKPAPERKLGGAAPGVSGALDNALERLRAEAEKTGDYTKVSRYKRENGLK